MSYLKYALIALTVFWSGLSFAVPPSDVSAYTCWQMNVRSRGEAAGINPESTALAACEIVKQINAGYQWSADGSCTLTNSANAPGQYEFEHPICWDLNGCETKTTKAALITCTQDHTEQSCDDLDNPWAITVNGVITDCVPDPCDGDIIHGGPPSEDEKQFFATNGYTCTPESSGGCKAYPIGPAPDGGYMYREHSEGGHCSSDDLNDPDGTPFDSNDPSDDPGGPDPNGTDPNEPDLGYEPCGAASPYSPFCQADPSDECPGGVCRSGCGYFNGQFICMNDDYYNPPDPSNPYNPPADDGGPSDGFNDAGDNGGSSSTQDSPDGDSTGDGTQNIDLGPTNALLQEIRNKLTGDQALANEAIGDSESSIGDAVQKDIDDFQNLTDSMNDFTIKTASDFEGEAGGLIDDEFGADIVGQIAPFGASCPVISIPIPNQSAYSFDSGEIGDKARPFFGFIIWMIVALNAYFIFFKWALN